ncbi:hypothetical protein SAMN05216411_102285 [Nitrosospira multiformis]|nr:hypothetical protein SAMN05216411_102285 [Nitrosospira multiformis]
MSVCVTLLVKDTSVSENTGVARASKMLAVPVRTTDEEMSLCWALLLISQLVLAPIVMTILLFKKRNESIRSVLLLSRFIPIYPLLPLGGGLSTHSPILKVSLSPP